MTSTQLQSGYRNLDRLEVSNTQHPTFLSTSKCGELCNEHGESNAALDYIQRSLKISLENNLQTGNAYCTIANCYQELGQSELAIEYYQRGIKEIRLIGDTSGEVVYLNNIALIYARQKRFDEAERLFKQILPLVHEQDIPFNKSLVYGNYGDVLGHMKRYDEAIHMFSEAIHFAENVSDLCHIAFSTGLAKILSLQGHHAKAVDTIQSLDLTKIDPIKVPALRFYMDSQ